MQISERNLKENQSGREIYQLTYLTAMCEQVFRREFQARPLEVKVVHVY